ncbi:MAG TPA: hypothetical protein VFP34_00040 [Microlunatus sp.]|nr:hypothetical protein [Microlunatus sp.]
MDSMSIRPVNGTLIVLINACIAVFIPPHPSRSSPAATVDRSNGLVIGGERIADKNLQDDVVYDVVPTTARSIRSPRSDTTTPS